MMAQGVCVEQGVGGFFSMGQSLSMVSRAEVNVVMVAQRLQVGYLPAYEIDAPIEYEIYD